MMIAGGRTPVKSTFVGFCIIGVNIGQSRKVLVEAPHG